MLEKRTCEIIIKRVWIYLYNAVESTFEGFKVQGSIVEPGSDSRIFPQGANLPIPHQVILEVGKRKKGAELHSFDIRIFLMILHI